MESSLPPDSYEGCANDVRRLLGAGRLVTARAVRGFRKIASDGLPHVESSGGHCPEIKESC